MPVLVAMAQSGETFISCTPERGYWLHLPAGAGGSGPIDEATVQRSIAEHGFVRVDEEYASWPQLDQGIQDRTQSPAVIVDQNLLDVEDIVDLLDVAQQWIVNDEGQRASHLVSNLLRIPIVRRDDALFEKVTAILLELTGTPLTSVRRLSLRPIQAAARYRWGTLRAAA
jgi:hypothetical protein